MQDTIGVHSEEDASRARNATVQARPQDVKGFFARQFRSIIPSRPVAAPEKIPIRSLPDDDPYAF